MSNLPSIGIPGSPLGQVTACALIALANSPKARRGIAKGIGPPGITPETLQTPHKDLSRREKYHAATWASRFLNWPGYEFNFDDPDPADPRTTSLNFQYDPRMPRKLILQLIAEQLSTQGIGSKDPEPTVKIEGLAMKPETALRRLESYLRVQFIDGNSLSIHKLNAAGQLGRTSEVLRREARSGAEIIGFFEAAWERQFRKNQNCRRKQLPAEV